MTVLELDPKDDYVLTIYLPFTSAGTPKLFMNATDLSSSLTYSEVVTGAPEGTLSKLTINIKADSITASIAGCVDCYFDNGTNSKTRVLYARARIANVC